MDTKGNRAKQHHYLPACYLAGFTLSGEKDGVLHVLDQEKIKEWASSPQKAARCGNFYDIDLGPDVHPNVIEDILSRIETLAGGVIREIVQNKTLPTGEHFDWLLNFVAVQAARTPRIRNLVSGVVEKTVKNHLCKSIETPSGWHEFKEFLIERGTQVCEEDREHYRQFVSDGDYSVAIDQTWHVKMMIDMVNELLPYLADRHWTLGVVADNAPDLICSDFPVGIMPLKAVNPSAPMTRINPNTLLTFPLTRRLIVLAASEPRPPVVGVHEGGVAGFNAITVTGAKYVLSGRPDFFYLDSGKTLRQKSDLLRFLQQRRDDSVAPDLT